MCPLPVTVTTRIIIFFSIFLVGDRVLNLHLPLLLEGGRTQLIIILFLFEIFLGHEQTAAFTPTHTRRSCGRVFVISVAPISMAPRWDRKKQRKKKGGQKKTGGQNINYPFFRGGSTLISKMVARWIFLGEDFHVKINDPWKFHQVTPEKSTPVTPEIRWVFRVWEFSWECFRGFSNGISRWAIRFVPQKIRRAPGIFWGPVGVGGVG